MITESLGEVHQPMSSDIAELLEFHCCHLPLITETIKTAIRTVNMRENEMRQRSYSGEKQLSNDSIYGI